jgi:hypothetical protein
VLLIPDYGVDGIFGSGIILSPERSSR